ncbi:MAG TPA: hypothetical protein EYH57_04675, partial [Sulfurovum sp.]|nr:hypothetical protein [Sulfurovum sp.]
MKKIIGYLKNLTEQCFAKDAQGNLREIQPGEAIFENEIVVNVRGEVIPDALREATEDQIDSNEEASNTEAPLSEEKPEEDSDTPTSHDAKSATSTDTIEPEPTPAVNINAPL